MSTLPSDHDLAEEDRRARQLRLIVDLTSNVIMQGGIDRREAEALVAATRRRALELFPGKEGTFDLVLAPRFVRLIREFTANQPVGGPSVGPAPPPNVLPFRRH